MSCCRDYTFDVLARGGLSVEEGGLAICRGERDTSGDTCDRFGDECVIPTPYQRSRERALHELGARQGSAMDLLHAIVWFGTRRAS